MGTKMRISHGFWGVTALAAALVSLGAFAAGAPAVGDTYTYRLVNGYSKEVRGQLRYEVSRVDADRVTFAVTPDNAQAGIERTEIYTREGNWLRSPLESHGQQVDYDFATAYPAYVFPLDPGKSWSVRVKASVEGAARGRSVRVDGRVLGAERVRVPAGEYDAIKVRRFVYPDDAGNFLSETHIVEFDWYVPALGRVVRTERTSSWLSSGNCDELSGCDYYGDWSVFELVEAQPARS